jgi:hypothetical protein
MAAAKTLRPGHSAAELSATAAFPGRSDGEIDGGALVETKAVPVMPLALVAALADLSSEPAVVVGLALKLTRPAFPAPITAIVGTENVESFR